MRGQIWVSLCTPCGLSRLPWPSSMLAQPSPPPAVRWHGMCWQSKRASVRVERIRAKTVVLVTSASVSAAREHCLTVGVRALGLPNEGTTAGTAVRFSVPSARLLRLQFRHRTSRSPSGSALHASTRLPNRERTSNGSMIKWLGATIGHARSGWDAVSALAL